MAVWEPDHAQEEYASGCTAEESVYLVRVTSAGYDPLLLLAPHRQGCQPLGKRRFERAVPECFQFLQVEHLSVHLELQVVLHLSQAAELWVQARRHEFLTRFEAVPVHLRLEPD